MSRSDCRDGGLADCPTAIWKPPRPNGSGPMKTLSVVTSAGVVGSFHFTDLLAFRRMGRFSLSVQWVALQPAGVGRAPGAVAPALDGCPPEIGRASCRGGGGAGEWPGA